MRSPRLLVCVALVAAGCVDFVSPHESRTELDAAAPSFALNTVTYTLGQTAPENPSFSMTLDIVSEPTLAKVSFDGILNVSHWSGGSIVNIDPRGYWHSGQNTCAAQMSISFSGRGSWKPGCASSVTTPKYGQQSHVETLLILHGSGTARRSGAIPTSGSCGSDPCHRYAGTQTVTIEPIDAFIQLTPSSRSVLPGGSASFTASFTPSTYGGKSVPSRVVGWRFLPDSGPTPALSCGQNPTCTVPNVQKSGQLFCDAYANGEFESKRARIRAIACKTDNEWLDEDSVRAAMRRLWANSSPNDPNTANRRERGAYIILDTLTGQMSTYDWTTSSTPCSSTGDSSAQSAIGPNEVVVVSIHTHPFSNGDVLPAASFRECRKGQRFVNQTVTYDATGGGLSVVDWAGSTDFAWDVYVVDADKIYWGDGARVQEIFNASAPLPGDEWLKNGQCNIL